MRHGAGYWDKDQLNNRAKCKARERGCRRASWKRGHTNGSPKMSRSLWVEKMEGYLNCSKLEALSIIIPDNGMMAVRAGMKRSV